MDEGTRCERCPLLAEDEPCDSKTGKLCAELIEYPVWVAEKDQVVVQIDRPEDFPEAFREFTDRFFAEVMKRPGVSLDPRAFLRIRTSESTSGRPRSLCPFSFPTEGWERLAIEQVVTDMSGMQPRYMKNHLSWLEQSALYTDVVTVVQEAKGIATKWLDEKKKESTPK